MTTVATHLERALKEDFTPELAERLSDAGLEVGEPLPKRLKIAEIARWLEVVREVVYAALPRGEGLRQLGQRALDGFGQSLAETAILAFLKVLGPEHALKQAEARLRRTPLGLTVTMEDRRNATVHVTDAQGMPEFVQGLLEAFGKRLGTKEIEVELEPDGARAATYRVKWK